MHESNESIYKCVKEFHLFVYFLPQDNTMAIANDNPVGRDADSLLAAGDSRANVQPGLIALHTLFVREHNRLCDEYKRKHPQVE